MDDLLDALSEPDGYGRYGYLDADESGERVLCHECGVCFAFLGKHVGASHGISPGEYRMAHGLPRRLGLVAPVLAARQGRRAQARKGAPGWLRMRAVIATAEAEANRALAHRRAVAGRPYQGAADRRVRMERARELGRGRRLGRVLIRAECGASWCSLAGAGRRQTCARPECVRALIRRRALARAQERRGLGEA